MSTLSNKAFRMEARGLLAALCIALGGCAWPERETFLVSSAGEVTAADTPLPAQLPREQASGSIPVRHLAGVDGRSLNLGRVLALVSAGNPDLMASSSGVEAVAARRIDAGKLANPEASIYSEDLGEKPLPNGFVGTQTTLQLSQAVPLTGKLGHQRAVARGEYNVARREYDIRRLEIFGEATRTFIALLVAQERASLASDQLALVERLSGAEEAQVEAGVLAPFQHSRAVTALAEARLRVSEARRDIQVLRQRLASFWGGDAASFRDVTGKLASLPPLPALPALLARLDESPETVRSASEIALRRSAVALERARATPDITLTGGVRRHELEGDYAFVAGLSAALPVASQNRSAIFEAGRKQQQAEFQLNATKNRLKSTISEDYAKLTSTAAEIEALRKTLIPSSEDAISALREGYRLRKFQLSELLIAEQSLTSLRDKLLTTLGTYHQTYADLEQLLGGDLYDRPTAKFR